MFSFQLLPLLKKYCLLKVQCNVIGDFIGFSKFTGTLLSIQNGGLHWLDRSQNFDFRIAITFLMVIRFRLGLL